MLLKDKVAVITGGAGLNGLGYATARQMAAQGANIAHISSADAISGTINQSKERRYP
jgi:NAD(P)-dependent dehydrogenase (short-subunit alcohol dehydrogenase family)